MVSGLIESIEGGRNLSGALAEYPEVFSKVFVSLVRSGEQTGRLSEVLKSLSESIKWEDALAANEDYMPKNLTLESSIKVTPAPTPGNWKLPAKVA